MNGFKPCGDVYFHQFVIDGTTFQFLGEEKDRDKYYTKYISIGRNKERS